jgi:hypothetical protein
VSLVALVPPVVVASLVVVVLAVLRVLAVSPVLAVRWFSFVQCGGLTEPNGLRPILKTWARGCLGYEDKYFKNFRFRKESK